jgi:3-hydroxyisobutyrate dehydrogenase
MAKPSVALLGLGIMGSGMAGRLLSAGFPLSIYNRNREKAKSLAEAGAFLAACPREAAARAEIVICIVADDAASRAIWLGADGALAGARAGAVLIESSTVTASWIQELAAAAAQRGCELLDAPVTGTKPHAANGELLFLVGGSAKALETARPALAVMSRDVVHLGPTGSGATMKLINNFVCGVQAAALAEAAAFIQGSGLDPERAMSILTNGAPGSPLVKTLASRVSAGNSETNFVLRLMAKDLDYAILEAAHHSERLQTAQAALNVFRQAIADGYGEKDFSAVINAATQLTARESKTA